MLQVERLDAGKGAGGNGGEGGPIVRRRHPEPVLADVQSGERGEAVADARELEPVADERAREVELTHGTAVSAQGVELLGRAAATHERAAEVHLAQRVHLLLPAHLLPADQLDLLPAHTLHDRRRLAASHRTTHRHVHCEAYILDHKSDYILELNFPTSFLHIVSNS